MGLAVLFSVAACSWFAPAGWTVGARGTVASRGVVPEQVTGEEFTMTKGSRLVVATDHGGFSVPSAVLDRIRRITITRVWVPVLQVPTLAGTQVTVATSIHVPLPAAWQAPGVPRWSDIPWSSLVTRRVAVPPETTWGAVMTLYLPLVVATVEGAGPGMPSEVLHMALRVGHGYRLGSLRSVAPIAPKLFCINNPPMGSHFSTMRGSRVVKGPSVQVRNWSMWGESVKSVAHYTLFVYARSVGVIVYSDNTQWRYMYLQKTNSSGYILAGCA